MSDETQNRVWIEIEPASNIEEARKICAKINAMMNKLGVDGQNGEVFAPNETTNPKTAYIHIQDSSGSFTELEDNGQWFNLNFLAK